MGKRQIVFSIYLVFAFLFVSCTTQSHDTIDVGINEIKEASFGSQLFSITRNSKPQSNFANQNQYTDEIRQQLTFTGTRGSAIKLTYNEYIHQGSSWLIKPAFTQDLEYDLTISKNISFRGIKMFILSADNERIVYKVLEWK